MCASTSHSAFVTPSLVSIFLLHGLYVWPASAKRLLNDSERVNVVELQHTEGRLGNRLVTLTNAIHIAIHDAANCVFLSDEDWPEWLGQRSKTVTIASEDRQICNDARADPRFVGTRTLLPGAFWKHKPVDRAAHAMDVRKIMNGIFNISSSVTVAPSDTMHIHMRGGDIFSMSGTGMVQPPCSFYRSQIDLNMTRVKQVTIVSEDKANPCVDDVRKSYGHTVYAGQKSLEEDVRTLLGARRLVVGRGTFVPALTMFAPNLEAIHFCEDDDALMHEFLSVYNPATYIQKHTECASYYKNVAGMGGWEMEDKTQRENIVREMLTYKCGSANKVVL